MPTEVSLSNTIFVTLKRNQHSIRHYFVGNMSIDYITGGHGRSLPVTLCAGLLAFGWNIRIKFKIFGSGRVADVTLGFVLELHCTVFLAIQPDCKTLIIQFQ